MKIEAIGNMVLVERSATVNKSESGMVIPLSGQEKQSQGIVKNVGKLVIRDIKQGDVVLFRKFAGDEVRSEEKECLLLDEREIQGRVVE